MREKSWITPRVAKVGLEARAYTESGRMDERRAETEGRVGYATPVRIIRIMPGITVVAVIKRRRVAVARIGVKTRINVSRITRVNILGIGVVIGHGRWRRRVNRRGVSVGIRRGRLGFLGRFLLALRIRSGGLLLS